jgi:urease beta subunit
MVGGAVVVQALAHDVQDVAERLVVVGSDIHCQQNVEKRFLKAQAVSIRLDQRVQFGDLGARYRQV